QKNLAGLSTNLRQIQGSTTTDGQYQRALAQFRRRPNPAGQVLNWVCRDNLSYLDLTENRLEMDPDNPESNITGIQDPVQKFGAQYGIRNQEPAETNGGHLQAASPGKIPGPAGASGRIHFGV